MVERTDDHPGTGSATYCSAVRLRQASKTLVLAQRSYANNATTSSCMRISPGLGQRMGALLTGGAMLWVRRLAPQCIHHRRPRQVLSEMKLILHRPLSCCLTTRMRNSYSLVLPRTSVSLPTYVPRNDASFLSGAISSDLITQDFAPICLMRLLWSSPPTIR